MVIIVRSWILLIVRGKGRTSEINATTKPNKSQAGDHLFPGDSKLHDLLYKHKNRRLLFLLFLLFLLLSH